MMPDEPTIPEFSEPNEDDVADEADTSPEVNPADLPDDVRDGDIGELEPPEEEG